MSHGVVSDDEDISGNSCEEWQPSKRHPDISYSQGRGYDIVALLVSIYVSTDLFVSEYRTLLSEKLLQLTVYDGDAEISTLELLKIRYISKMLPFIIIYLLNHIDRMQTFAMKRVIHLFFTKYFLIGLDSERKLFIAVR